MSDHETLPAVRDEGSRRERWGLVRDLGVFQVKLFLDGLKDFVLLPVSMVAAIVDIVSAGRGRSFYTLLRAGRAFDGWLNLFGAADRKHTMDAPQGADAYFAQLEQAIMQSHARGGLTAKARDALDRALDAVQSERPGALGERPADEEPPT